MTECPTCDGGGTVLNRECPDCTEGRVSMTDEQQAEFLCERFEELQIGCLCRGALYVCQVQGFGLQNRGDYVLHCNQKSPHHGPNHNVTKHKPCKSRGWNPPSGDFTLALMTVLSSPEVGLIVRANDPSIVGSISFLPHQWHVIDPKTGDVFTRDTLVSATVIAIQAKEGIL